MNDPKRVELGPRFSTSARIRTRLLFGVGLALLASPILAQYAVARWNYLEFREETQIGNVAIKVVVDKDKLPRTVKYLGIAVDGRKLKVPDKVIRILQEPHLDRVKLDRIGAIQCVSEDECDPAIYPVLLHIPYGDAIPRDSEDDGCLSPELFIEFTARRVISAELWECSENEDNDRSIKLFEDTR